VITSLGFDHYLLNRAELQGERRKRDEIPTTAKRELTKAVYCTCWDGDIVINAATLEVSTSP